jgi:hypothetical protein
MLRNYLLLPMNLRSRRLLVELQLYKGRLRNSQITLHGKEVIRNVTSERTSSAYVGETVVTMFEYTIAPWIIWIQISIIDTTAVSLHSKSIATVAINGTLTTFILPCELSRILSGLSRCSTSRPHAAKSWAGAVPWYSKLWQVKQILAELKPRFA